MILEREARRQSAKKTLTVELPVRVSRSRYAQLSRMLCRLCSISNLKVMCFIGLVISFGYSGFIPAIHLIAEYGLMLAYRQAAGGWVSLMCLLYTASAVMYATRIPERFFPGKCDIWVSR